MQKTGFITVIGLPSVGKSSLINRIIGKKVLIESSTNQSTRNSIQAVKNIEENQLIFVDTPGIHVPHNQFGRFLNKVAYRSIAGVDVIIFVINKYKGIGKIEKNIINRIKEEQIPVILVLNKIDQIKDKQEIAKIYEEYAKEIEFKEFIPISVTQNINIDIVESKIIENLPVGEKFYEEDLIVNKSERFLISETIREKINLYTYEEIPHSTIVYIEEFKEKADLVIIDALIIIERASQKPIILGKNGTMIKKIGIKSREELELYFGKKVVLKTFVKVEKNWRERQSKLLEYDYDINNEL